MRNITYIGFHATQRKYLNDIIENGYKISHNTQLKKQWLGNGVYFWVDDYYAAEWNIIKSKNRSKKYIIRNYTILKSIITTNIDRVLDLSSPMGNRVLTYLINEIKKRFIEAGKEEYIDIILKKSDKFKIDLLQDSGSLDDYDVILATYRKKNIEKEEGIDNFNEWEQRQICVRNLKAIKKTKEYTEMNRINQLFDAIYENRKIKIGMR